MSSEYEVELLKTGQAIRKEVPQLGEDSAYLKQSHMKEDSSVNVQKKMVKKQIRASQMQFDLEMKTGSVFQKQMAKH